MLADKDKMWYFDRSRKKNQAAKKNFEIEMILFSQTKDKRTIILTPQIPP